MVSATSFWSVIIRPLSLNCRSQLLWCPLLVRYGLTVFQKVVPDILSSVNFVWKEVLIDRRRMLSENEYLCSKMHYHENMYRPVVYIYIISIIGIYIICSIPIMHLADFTLSEVGPLHIMKNA